MRHSAVLLLLVIAAACGQARQSAKAPDPKGIHTLESADARPAVIDPPPVLTDEAPAIKLRDAVAAANLVPLTPADEQIRAKMPFAPAIAMDPVDGSKISIRATTPTVEVKGKLFYFSSEENKRTFLANTDQYMKGLFSHL
jgi:YHS domain-containing protein